MKRKRAGKSKNNEVQIGGNFDGQLAVGDHITQVAGSAGAAVSKADLEELRRMLKSLRDKVAAEAPADKKDDALGHVQELEQAVTEQKPDLTTMEYVRNWFVKQLPTIAGAVTSVVVHPIVGRLVEAGGDALVDEFHRRFGAAKG